MKTTVFYYKSARGEIPVLEFIDSYPTSKPKVMRIINVIKDYGLTLAIPHVKKLTNTPLWEIRILGRDNIRILYAVWTENGIILLHAFIKKSQKTPVKEIQIALNRLHELG